MSKALANIARIDVPIRTQLDTNLPIRRTYNFSDHRQIVNEIMLARAVESFDLYVISILKEISCSKPEILKSESSIEMSIVVDLKDFKEIVAFVAERKVHELSYKPLSDLKNYIVSRTGINLFQNESVFEIILVISEMRNLIAHNDCCMNQIFKQKTKDIDVSRLKTVEHNRVEITDEQVREWSYYLDGAVFYFDEAVKEKYQIQQFAWRGALSQ